MTSLMLILFLAGPDLVFRQCRVNDIHSTLNHVTFNVTCLNWLWIQCIHSQLFTTCVHLGELENKGFAWPYKVLTGSKTDHIWFVKCKLLMSLKRSHIHRGNCNFSQGSIALWWFSTFSFFLARWPTKKCLWEDSIISSSNQERIISSSQDDTQLQLENCSGYN